MKETTELAPLEPKLKEIDDEPSNDNFDFETERMKTKPETKDTEPEIIDVIDAEDIEHKI